MTKAEEKISRDPQADEAGGFIGRQEGRMRTPTASALSLAMTSVQASPTHAFGLSDIVFANMTYGSFKGVIGAPEPVVRETVDLRR